MELNPQSLPLFSSKSSRPEVFVPSPRMLELNPYDFMPKKSSGCKTSNAFMIYRTIYGRTLSQVGLPSKMTEVSRWASEAWSVEREELKSEFREFAGKVSKIYRERAQIKGVPRISPILPIQPNKLPSDNNINNKTPNITYQNITYTPIIQQQPPPAYANYQEQLYDLPFSPHYPLIRHDIYLTPQFSQCKICKIFNCYCLEEDDDSVNKQDSQFTTLQNIYDGDINMNMDNYNSFF